MSRTASPVAPRLLSSFVEINGCWVWQKYAWRYGQITWGGRDRVFGAHVASYMIHKGAVPKGMCVLHTCDNPRCINPDHLWLGTNAENTADKVRKGRQAKGEATRFCKLTPEQVTAIRASTASHRQIAKEFGLAKASVTAIINRKSWKHLP